MINMNEHQLLHYGVKGMKWGVRRYQDKDGALTNAGRKRYIDYKTGKLTRKGEKRLRKVGEDSMAGKYIRAERQVADVGLNWYKSHNKAADAFDQKLAKINKKYGDKATINNKEYVREVGKTWKDLYSKQLLKDFGPDVLTNGKDWVKNMPTMNDYDDL